MVMGRDGEAGKGTQASSVLPRGQELLPKTDQSVYDSKTYLKSEGGNFQKK